MGHSLSNIFDFLFYRDLTATMASLPEGISLKLHTTYTLAGMDTVNIPTPLINGKTECVYCLVTATQPYPLLFRLIVCWPELS